VIGKSVMNDTRADEGSMNLDEGHSMVSGASHLSREYSSTLKGSCKLVIGFV
jgi:hypothetical protein